MPEQSNSVPDCQGLARGCTGRVNASQAGCVTVTVARRAPGAAVSSASHGATGTQAGGASHHDGVPLPLQWQSVSESDSEPSVSESDSALPVAVTANVAVTATATASASVGC